MTRILQIIVLATSLFFNSGNAQNLELSVLGVPPDLKENANSVVRTQEVTIEIKSISNMVVKTRKVTTVFNEKGFRNIDASEHYNKTTSVNSIEAVVYNSFGKELKKIKRKDFFDQSVADGFSVVNDSRRLFLNYIPTEYPFTIVYESEVQTSNTAFIPRWYPVDDYNESIQKSVFTITYPSDLGFKSKEVNFGNKKIIKEQTGNSLKYSVENLLAEKEEEYAPFKFTHVLFGLDKFELEGVEGNAKTWKEFGLWMNDKLLKGSTEIPQETQNKIKALVGDETDPIKKARKVYQYVQDKTRYVSIQLGIGGWKPMLARDVDRLGYGDCKALSNYTKSLLEVVGVPSYYAIIYGDDDRRDILEDFVAMQGNHAVLAIPQNQKLTFLECTSQTQAFGFEGDFTDDRFALIIKPDGGEIVKTNQYVDKDNAQITVGKVKINEDGSMNVNATLTYTGIQYNTISDIEKLPTEKVKESYKGRWGYINNLVIDEVKLLNSKENVQFKEDVKLSATGFVQKIGMEKMMNINILNQNQNIPQRYRNRKNEFEIKRGFYDEDTVEIELPANNKIVAKPENSVIETKFGTYKTEIAVLNPNKLQYKRSLLIKKGIYNTAEYEEYRKFREQIAKQDNSKIILQDN
jgi:transglutaminase-like putative cysteine protease